MIYITDFQKICLQIVAAIMAITGIVMMAYADGFHGDSFVGVALAVGSASTSALYKVRFKGFCRLTMIIL